MLQDLHMNVSLIKKTTFLKLSAGVYMTKRHVLQLVWKNLIVPGVSTVWMGNLFCTSVSFRFWSHL